MPQRLHDTPFEHVIKTDSGGTPEVIAAVPRDVRKGFAFPDDRH